MKFVQIAKISCSNNAPSKENLTTDIASSQNLKWVNLGFFVTLLSWFCRRAVSTCGVVVAAQIAGTPILLSLSLQTAMAPCASAWMLSEGVANAAPAGTTTPPMLCPTTTPLLS